MERRDPNILDRILEKIPGYSSYARAEGRRDSDARLRSAVAERLDAAKPHVNELTLELTNEGRLDALPKMERLKKKLDICADSVRHVERGGSGAMDDVVVSEQTLQQLFEHDLALLDRADRIRERVVSLKTDQLDDELDTIMDDVAALSASIDDREKIIREVF